MKPGEPALVGLRNKTVMSENPYESPEEANESEAKPEDSLVWPVFALMLGFVLLGKGAVDFHAALFNQEGPPLLTAAPEIAWGPLMIAVGLWIFPGIGCLLFAATRFRKGRKRD